MKKTKRQQEIINYLETYSSISTADLADKLGVTPMTIRRDLAYLEKNNLLKRSHGFAHSTTNTDNIPDINDRNNINQEEKFQIAKKALSLIKPGQSIILDSGSTTLLLAKLIKQEGISNLIIITNSLSIAQALAGSYQTLLCGGIVQERHMSLIGPEAESYFEIKTADIVFLGATGARSTLGLTTSSPFQYAIKKQMIKSSQRIVALIDSSKFEINSLNMFCEYSEIDTIITTRNEYNKSTLDRIKKLGVNVILTNE